MLHPRLLAMKTNRSYALELLRISPMLAALVSLPAVALDVRLTFQLPRSMGYVEAGFSGFDNNRDGSIRSSDNEVVSAWSSLTGTWVDSSLTRSGEAVAGKIDIQYEYPDDSVAQNDGYGGNEYSGLTRFVIETKLQEGNHVNSSGVTFRLNARHPFFSSFGFRWSEVYNAPSNYSYSFEGPENPVQLALATTGNVFAAPVPESGSFVLLLAGLMAVLARTWNIRLNSGGLSTSQADMQVP
jgi:hypothetical protein